MADSEKQVINLFNIVAKPLPFMYCKFGDWYFILFKGQLRFRCG